MFVLLLGAYMQVYMNGGVCEYTCICMSVQFSKDAYNELITVVLSGKEMFLYWLPQNN